jgi:inhibitor of cysteine peptidase
MKKLGILAAVVTIFLVAGCASAVKTYTDPEQTISISVNQEFVIALSSNPTTGYGWQESFNETTLKLVEKTYKPGEMAEQGAVGAGGTEYFRFKALKKGKTEITIVYKRAWEEEIIGQKVFTVNIN